MSLRPAIDRGYPLSVGFVRLHDAAAIGRDLSAVPAPAGLADDATSPVKSSRLATVIVANYGECRADAERLTALQEWVRTTQANFNQGTKP